MLTLAFGIKGGEHVCSERKGKDAGGTDSIPFSSDIF